MAALSLLWEVSKKYSISFEELRDSIFSEFNFVELVDLAREYFADTRHFDHFLRKHEIKQVNSGIVVLYLKSIKLEVSNRNLSCDLKYTKPALKNTMSTLKNTMSTLEDTKSALNNTRSTLEVCFVCFEKMKIQKRI